MNSSTRDSRAREHTLRETPPIPRSTPECPWSTPSVCGGFRKDLETCTFIVYCGVSIANLAAVGLTLLFFWSVHQSTYRAANPKFDSYLSSRSSSTFPFFSVITKSLSQNMCLVYVCVCWCSVESSEKTNSRGNVWHILLDRTLSSSGKPKRACTSSRTAVPLNTADQQNNFAHAGARQLVVWAV